MHKRKEYRDSTPMIQYDRWGVVKTFEGSFFWLPGRIWFTSTLT